MAQQTAVDYLVNLYYTQYNVLLPSEDYEQAKQMEKEQIIAARINGDENHSLIGNKIKEYAEQYYNETFTSTPQGESPSAIETGQS